MTDRQKYLQIRKEAAFTGLALAVLIVFWLIAGFGVAQLDIKVVFLPLWAVSATIGTWFFAMLLVKLLTSSVFKDIEFDDEEAGK